MMLPSALNPVVKWAGGKRRLLPEIRPLLPADLSLYCEPFFGGGAVAFALQPTKAIFNDCNPELMTLYRVIRDSPQELLADLRGHENTAAYYYRMRNLDREEETYNALSDVERASRFLYLNHTCFNGLHRVNKAGQFNVPYGHYAEPNLVPEADILAMSRYLNTADIVLANQDFAAVLDGLASGSFAYLDPPYDTLPGAANFTAYTRHGFDWCDQERLKDCCDAMTRRGVRFLLSNAATDAILALYRGYTVTTVTVRRSICADGGKRGAAKEVLIQNY